MSCTAAPFLADQFRQNCRVISHTAPGVENTIAAFQFECVNPVGQCARLPVVQPARTINRNQHVFIQRTRILGCEDGCAFALLVSRWNDQPGAGSEEFFAPHGSESGFDEQRGDSSRSANLSCISLAALLQRRGGVWTIAGLRKRCRVFILCPGRLLRGKLEC